MIRVDDFVKALSLTTLCASSKNEWPIESADLNRPGLQFAGHYEYFAMERPQVIGKAEMGYLESLEPEVRVARLRKFFSYPSPCGRIRCSWASACARRGSAFWSTPSNWTAAA